MADLARVIALSLKSNLNHSIKRIFGLTYFIINSVFTLKVVSNLW